MNQNESILFNPVDVYIDLDNITARISQDLGHLEFTEVPSIEEWRDIVQLAAEGNRSLYNLLYSDIPAVQTVPHRSEPFAPSIVKGLVDCIHYHSSLVYENDMQLSLFIY